MSATKRPLFTQPGYSPSETPTDSVGEGPLRKAQAIIVGLSLLLLGISIAHSLEDFVYGIPARFGLSVATAALLLGAGYVVQVTGILLATRGQRIGFVLTFATGVGWSIAAALDHLGEVLIVWPYREGVISKALEIGIMLTGGGLALVSLWTLLPLHQRRMLH
ncbi:MAG: hypothetical protein PVSMB5_35610 [Ktedonobacteraceae bacterium]